MSSCDVNCVVLGLGDEGDNVEVTPNTKLHSVLLEAFHFNLERFIGRETSDHGWEDSNWHEPTIVADEQRCDGRLVGSVAEIPKSVQFLTCCILEDTWHEVHMFGALRARARLWL